MNMDRKIIIAAIAVFVVILAGIMMIAPNNQNENPPKPKNLQYYKTQKRTQKQKQYAKEETGNK